MDPQKLKQKVQAAQARQPEVKESVLAVRGQAYLYQAMTIAGIVMLGRSLALAGFPDVATNLTGIAAEAAIHSWGLAYDEAQCKSLMLDALALADAPPPRWN
ncbi:hypothetical protein H4CHR_02896 [Variovorax sp. PBS-H4]|nr:hypothetical protein H4CHR_02896 [Variovorax sp. PBS-H4]